PGLLHQGNAGNATRDGEPVAFGHFVGSQEFDHRAETSPSTAASDRRALQRASGHDHRCKTLRARNLATASAAHKLISLPIFYTDRRNNPKDTPRRKDETGAVTTSSPRLSAWHGPC